MSTEDTIALNDEVNEDSDQSDEWDEMETSGSEQTNCLFCPLNFHTIAVALDHCRTKHNFNLLDLKIRFRMDCYSYIKMINYIRIEKPQDNFIDNDKTNGNPPWENDKYLKPVDTEPWLMYDFDDLGSAPSTPHYAVDGKDPINELTCADLLRQIRDLTLQLEHRDSLLKRASEDIERIRQVSKAIIESADEKYDYSESSKVRCLPLGEHKDYFDSYSYLGIHHEMLSDKVRTSSYQRAILHNPSVFHQAAVLDLGCGTGILSLFARAGGAAHVTAIDAADRVLEHTRQILTDNPPSAPSSAGSSSGEITLVLGRVESTPLPQGDKGYDVIVSEWMGYCLLYEGMLDSVVYARDKYLKEGGKMLPDRAVMEMVAVDDQARYGALVDFWHNVYTFNMSSIRPFTLLDATVETIPSAHVISLSPAFLHDIDLYRCTKDSVYVTTETPFSLVMARDGVLTALACYFTCHFQLAECAVVLSTSPAAGCERTHWEQTVLYLDKVMEVKEGDVVEGVFTCKRSEENKRGLVLTVQLKGRELQMFYMN